MKKKGEVQGSFKGEGGVPGRIQEETVKVKRLIFKKRLWGSREFSRRDGEVPGSFFFF